MSTVVVNVDFAIREARARELAKFGDHLTAGLLLQDIELLREAMARQAPAVKAEEAGAIPAIG